MLIPWIFRWLGNERTTFWDSMKVGACLAPLFILLVNVPASRYVLGVAIAIDIIVLIVRTVNHIFQPYYAWRRRQREAERAREEANENARRERERQERAEQEKLLRQKEADQQALIKRQQEEFRLAEENRRMVQEQLEPAANAIRRFWARYHLIVSDNCSLSVLNNKIRSALSEQSPYDAASRLANIKHSLQRVVICHNTDELYEKFYEYISKAIPRDEYERLKEEIDRTSPTVDLYGPRMLELGEFLGEAAGPAAVKWQKEREQKQIKAYEKWFNDEEEDELENPFAEEKLEDTRESRVG